MSYIIVYLNNLILLITFIAICTPAIFLGYIVGNIFGKQYGILIGILYSPCIPTILKFVLKHVPLLG
jgi:hypothetical protein